MSNNVFNQQNEFVTMTSWSNLYSVPMVPLTMESEMSYFAMPMATVPSIPIMTPNFIVPGVTVVSKFGSSPGYTRSTVTRANSFGETDNKENQPPTNYKTKICLHFSQNRKCPKGASCGFAHGVHEMKPTAKNLAKKALNAKHKTKLCISFAKGGSMDCPYRCRCEFIHPHDPEYHDKKYFVETEEFARKLTHFKRKVQEIHTAKLKSNGTIPGSHFDAFILTLVKLWNSAHPRGPWYYDFHGLTLPLAEAYLEEIIEEMLEKRVEIARIETGRGNHSTNGFAAIRAMILTKYEGFRGAKFALEKGNDGILILTFN